MAPAFEEVSAAPRGWDLRKAAQRNHTPGGEGRLESSGWRKGILGKLSNSSEPQCLHPKNETTASTQGFCESRDHVSQPYPEKLLSKDSVSLHPSLVRESGHPGPTSPPSHTH